jgi:hypothetical protein
MFANARADGIAAVPDRSPSIAGLRPLAFCATCHVHRAQLIDEVFCVAGLVDAKRDRSRPVARSAIMCSAGRSPYSIYIVKRNRTFDGMLFR